MAVRKENRYQTVEEFRGALDRAINGAPTVPASQSIEPTVALQPDEPVPAPQPAEPAPAPKKKKKFILPACILAAAGIVALVILYMSTHSAWTRYDPYSGTVKETYRGELKDGDRHGQGTWTYYNEKGEVIETYKGEWKDDEWNGQGTYTYYDGNGSVFQTYEGEWKDGSPNGQGTWTQYDENGKVTDTKKGKWENGEFLG